jgi:hypothetical protein
VFKKFNSNCKYYSSGRKTLLEKLKEKFSNEKRNPILKASKNA